MGPQGLPGPQGYSGDEVSEFVIILQVDMSFANQFY